MPAAAVILSLVSLCAACTAPAPERAAAAHLQVRGTTFTRADGTVFQWRGISAFRLAELVARGKKDEAAAYLDWAASRHLTVVRVLTMARHLFPLDPADGARALPELLQMAAARGLHVEIVALADTGDMPVDVDAHVKAVGAIAGQHPNAIVEIANEPIHPTQAPRMHDPAEARRLRGFIPRQVPVALGSSEEHEGFAGGDYATRHFPRSPGPDGWGHVFALADGAALVAKLGKPLISDEPIGAAAEFVPGRRDNDPERFRAAALLTRLAGMGATFHYEGGLHARIPTGRELECFDAWNDAWSMLPADVEARGDFRRASEVAAAELVGDRAVTPGRSAIFERVRDDDAWVLTVGAPAESIRVQEGWRETDQRRVLGRAVLLTAARKP